MKRYTITLPDDVAYYLEVRAMGIDNIPTEQGIAALLTELVRRAKKCNASTR